MLGVEIVIDIRNTVECGLAQWRLRNVRCSGRTPLAVRLVGVQLALQAELCVGRRLIAVGFGQLLLQLLDALLQLTDFDLADCFETKLYKHKHFLQVFHFSHFTHLAILRITRLLPLE